jgi:H+-transporting ATPase
MKLTIIKWLRHHRAMLAAQKMAMRAALGGGVPSARTQSRAASVQESLYSNRVSFIRRAARKRGFGSKVSVKPEELQRFSSIQAHRMGETLARHPTRMGA